jgi:uncharacterized membrane protein
MDKTIYISELRKSLKGLPEEQKEDIIREIEQHISDAVAAGREESVVLSRLGAPATLAKSLAGEYYIKNNRVLKAIPFFMATGFESFFMIFMFGGLVLLFGAGAVESFAGGVMRTFGNTAVNITMFNMQVPRILSIPAGLFTATLLTGLAYLCVLVLKKYFIRVVNKYKMRIQLH